MQTSIPQITAEQRAAIAASGGLPVQVEDPATHKTYLLLEQPQNLDRERVDAELSKGIAALEAGDRVAWEPERIKQEGRRRLDAGNAPQ